MDKIKIKIIVFEFVCELKTKMGVLIRIKMNEMENDRIMNKNKMGVVIK